METQRLTDSRAGCPPGGGARLAGLIAALVLVASGVSDATRAQPVALGGIEGTVYDLYSAEPLDSVVVTVRGTTLGVKSAADGRYRVDDVPPGNYELTFSRPGFRRAELADVKVAAGQTSRADYRMNPEFFEMDTYEVVAELFEEQSLEILETRQSSMNLLDAIGSEQFSKLGLGDAAEVLGKVTGASVADGKFAVIRGLADRYTSTTLNGADIPSADPDRKAAQLDLFPSKFIERIDVSKTFSPDMPGGFAGGAIDIVTRTFPEQFGATLGIGFSYNTQASVNSRFLKTDHGGRDWLAMDDGTRELSARARASDPSTPRELDPAIKSEFGSSNFAPTFMTSPLNTSFELSVGDTVMVKERRLGYTAGITYKNDYNYYDNGQIRSYILQGRAAEVDMLDVQSVIEYTWGSLVGLSYEITETSLLNFNFMIVRTAEDEARRLRGQNDTFSTVPGESYIDQSVLAWTERSLQYYQLRGEHELPETEGTVFSWVGSLASTSQDEPDYRIFQYFGQPGDPDNPNDDFYGPDGPSQPARPTRVFREIDEDNLNLRMDLKIPVASYNEKENFLKTGGSLSLSERFYASRVFDVRMRGNHPFRRIGDPNIYAIPENHDFISYYNFPANFEYTGEQNIHAAYGMADWSVMNWLRVTGGLRVETTDIGVDTVNKGKNDERFVSSIESADLLPGISATVYFRENVILRAAWSETVVRPTYREISRAEVYDVAQSRTIRGNQDLGMSRSRNYDLRAEWYPNPGEILSLGVFMKQIDAPIEQASETRDNTIIFYDNFDQADVMGLEAEIRKRLGAYWDPLHEVEMGFNYAYIVSEVPLTEEQRRNRSGFDSATHRPLFDQPEYVINGDLTWDHSSTGTTLTLSGGVVGRRLTLVGLALPDDFVEPAPQLDVFLTQRLSDRWSVKFSARNLLDPEYRVTQEWPLGRLPIRSYTRGMTFGISASARF